VSEYSIPEDCRYSEKDEWVRSDGDHALIGVTDYAQHQLGDIVFVELPDIGSKVDAGESFGVIESVKAVSELYAPISGAVVAINEALEEAPESVNEDCYGDGWLISIEPSGESEMSELLDAEGYAKFLAERGE
jgi:glycine cleavage system H protein